MGDDKNGSQRGENSVLFSLNSLTAVGEKDKSTQRAAKQDNGGRGGSDKSGLIDLKTLTALGAGGGESEDGGSEGGGGGGGSDMPALFNVGTRRSGSKVALSIMLILVLGLGGVLAYLFLLKPPEAKPPSTGKAQLLVAFNDNDETSDFISSTGAELILSQAQNAASQLELEASSKYSDARLSLGFSKKASVEEEAVAVAETSSSKGSGRRKRTKKSGEDGGSSSKPETKKPVKPKEQSADDILGKTSKPGLSDKKIKSTIGGWRTPIGKCRKAGGSLKIRYTINSNGSVSGVSASGALAGSPTGNCVVGVFKKMRFPKFKGSSLKKSFPINF